MNPKMDGRCVQCLGGNVKGVKGQVTRVGRLRGGRRVLGTEYPVLRTWYSVASSLMPSGRRLYAALRDQVWSRLRKRLRGLLRDFVVEVTALTDSAEQAEADEEAERAAGKAEKRDILHPQPGFVLVKE